MSPIVSVIIPFYEHVEWLSEAVDSVLNQTLTDYEIIVINDGSKEDMTSFLKKYNDSIIYILKKNGGPASARNLGIEKARGKYLAFLDSDDLWERNKLEIQVHLMEKENAVWSHTGWVQFVNNDISQQAKKYTSGNNGYYFPMSLVSMNIATPSVIIQRQYIKERPYLRFQEKMRYGQDYYLWVSLSVEQPLFFISKVLTKVRMRESSAMKRARVHLQVRAQMWKYLNKNLPKLYLNKRLIFIRSVYAICTIEYKFISMLESKNIIGTKTSELLAKAIYIIPYILFKLIKFSQIYNKNIELRSFYK